MAKKIVVVGPDLMLDWDKYRNIMHELHGQIGRGVLTLDHLQAVVEHRNPFDAVTSPKTEFVQAVRSMDELLADWVNFYRDVFGEEVDFSGLRVPERREGFDRLIVVAKGMSPERVFQKCREYFRCAERQGLDEIVFDLGGVDRRYRRSDHETHAVWVRNLVKADQELNYQSANDLTARGIPGITLEARELYELKFFRETSNHLDARGTSTLCTGSRLYNRLVPSVHWSDSADRMIVLLHPPSFAEVFLRSREVV